MPDISQVLPRIKTANQSPIYEMMENDQTFPAGMWRWKVQGDIAILERATAVDWSTDEDWLKCDKGNNQVVVLKDLLPAADNTLDLGSAAASWNELHVQTVVYATSVTGNWSPSATGTYTLGTSTYGWLGIFVDATSGTDADIDIITANVTGTPKFWWDESEDAFSFDHKLRLGIFGDGTGVSTGTTGDVVGFFPEVPSGVTISDTARGLRVRFLINAAQTADCSLYAIQGQLRLKANLADGSHAGLFGYLEQSGTVVLSETAGGYNSAVSAAVETSSGITLNSGAVLAGVLISSNAHDSGAYNGDFDAIHIIKATGCEIWQTGMTITDSATTTGIDIGAVTTGIDFTSTMTAGISFDSATLVPDSTRTNMAIGIGSRAGELTVNIDNDASQNFEPFQMNINFTATGGAPTSTSTARLIRVRSTHDSTDMANLRIMSINTYMDVQKNMEAAYGCLHGIDFYTNAVAITTEAGVGVFNMDANSAVTGNVRGIIINLHGGGLPSTTSIGAEIRTDGGSATLAEGVRIWSVGSCSITTGLYILGTVTTGIQVDGATLAFKAYNAAGDAYLGLDSGDNGVAGNKGITFYAAGDEDIEIINLTNTGGTPRIFWDETEDAWSFNKGLEISAGSIDLNAQGGISNVGAAYNDWTATGLNSSNTHNIRSASNDSAALMLYSYSTTAATASLVRLVRSNHNTVASHGAVDADDVLGAVEFWGSDGDSYAVSSAIKGVPTETWSDTALGSKLEFWTVDNTTTVQDLRMTIAHNGLVTIANGLTVTAGTTTFGGAIQVNNTITVGSDGTGHDVKLYSATGSCYWEWDESDDRVNQAAVFGNTTGGEYAHKLTITDATTASADMHRGIVVDLTTSNNKTGSAHMEAFSADVTRWGNTPETTIIGAWVTHSGNPVIGNLIGLDIYFEDQGSGGTSNLMGAQITVNTTNIASSRHTPLRLTTVGAGNAKAGLLMDCLADYGLDMGGSIIGTADIRFQGGTTLTDDGTSLTLAGAVLVIPNGSAAAPSLRFTSEADVGFYYAGANTLGISAGGYAALIITSDGTKTTIMPATGDYLRIGDNATTSASLNSEDDLMVTGKLEVDGAAYLDSTLTMGGSINFGGQNSTNVATFFCRTTGSWDIFARYQAVGNVMTIYTAGVSPGWADTARMAIGGGAATTAVTWSNVTHTGMVLSGALDVAGQYLTFLERAAPGAGAANEARIYALEGAGDAFTDLCAVFQDGSIDVFAQETTDPDSPIFQFPDNTKLALAMRKPDRKTIQFVATFPDGRDFVMREIKYPYDRWN